MEGKEAARKENVCDKTFWFFVVVLGQNPEPGQWFSIELPPRRGTALCREEVRMTVNGGLSRPCQMFSAGISV